MSYELKQEIVNKIHQDYGVYNLFMNLGLENVTEKNGNVYCVCPFHEGADNPTGFAYSNGFGFCFTNCHKKVDLYDIVMKVKGYSFIEAMSYLADLTGVSLDYYMSNRKKSSDSTYSRNFLTQRRNIKKKKQSKTWKPLDQKIFNDFVPKLHKDLREEGFDEVVRDYFGIGFATGGYLQNRITIPVDSIDSSIVTVSGRIPKNVDDTNGRKYQIWFDTDKMVTLYNISRALPHIKEKGEVIVVEGFKSVWRLHQWGVYNVVAVMGSSMSAEQRKILLKLGVRIVVCGDFDTAGKKLNNQVVENCKRFADVEVMDMSMLSVDEKASIDDLTEYQYENLYENRK